MPTIVKLTLEWCVVSLDYLINAWGTWLEELGLTDRVKKARDLLDVSK